MENKNIQKQHKTSIKSTKDEIIDIPFDLKNEKTTNVKNVEENNNELIKPLNVQIPKNQQKLIIDKQHTGKEKTNIIIPSDTNILLNSKQLLNIKENNNKQPLLLLQQQSPKFKQNCSLSTDTHCCPCCANTTTQNEMSTFTPPPNLTTVADRFVLQHYSKAGSGGIPTLSGIPRKKAPQHRRLRKYASETSFCSSPGSSFGSVGSGDSNLLPPGQSHGRIRTVTLMNGRNDGNSGGDLVCEREIRSGARVFHVRPSGALSQQQSAHLTSAGNIVINQLQHQRRCQPQLTHSPQNQEIRKDSGDDASCSLGSGSTQGSNSQQTPLSQRRIIQIQQKQHKFNPSQQQQRFKMRRPRSTGQIIIQQLPNSKQKNSEIQQECNYSIEQHSGGSSSTTAGQSISDNHRCRTMSSGQPYAIHQNHSANCVIINNNNNNKGNNSTNIGYDPSYTSATVYSTDSIINIHSSCGQPNADTVSGTCTGSGAPMIADAIIPVDRRPSNYYLFEDDSAHEFDDEGSLSEINRRQSVHTAAPAIAFRSTLGFAAAIASANIGKISTVQPTPSFRHATPKNRPFFRRSSQPILNIAVPSGIISASSSHQHSSTHNYCHRNSAIGNLPSSSTSYIKNTQQLRLNNNTTNSDNIDISESDVKSGHIGKECLPSGVGSLPATMHKRVSWLSMKSLQDCTVAAASHFSGGIAMEHGTVFQRFSKKRDSSGILADNCSGKDSRFCDTRSSNSQLGSLLQLNNTNNNSGTLFGGMDDTTICYDTMECADTPPIDTMSWSNIDEFDNVTLMYSKHEKIPMKDFGSEIRATMDIDHLLNKAVLLLDLQETSLEEIFAKIIHEMDIQEPEFTSEQVRSVLFTQDAGNQFHILSRTVQSICTTGTIGGTFDYDQTWICALCMLNTVQHRHVAIARLSHPTNLGRTMQDLRFIIIVIAPSRAKGTKTALETTRTFATLFADMDIRQRLVMAHSVEAFRATLLDAAKELALEQSQWRERKSSIHLSQAKEQVFGLGKFFPFRGLIEDFKMRKNHYISDYLDGLRGHRTMQKMFSSIIFLYFACLLPAIAFGVLNDDNTGGRINVRKGILAQAIGGIFFAAFGGQPMIILLTTVPLAIYIKVIYRISESLGYDFFAMYACVGLWCQFFLVIYAATELCSLMKLATRSAEEMFSLFISIAFAVESVRAIYTSFTDNYISCIETLFNPTTTIPQNLSLLNQLNNAELKQNISQIDDDDNGCNRDTFVLYLLLMFGTLWVALFLYNFRKTPYLTRSRREWLADYALPASVLIMSFLGEYTFSKIDKDIFHMRSEVSLLRIPEFWRLSWQAILVCFLLGFFLSFLFYLDQNICSAIVNNNQNKLKKGSAQHLDLLVVSILNTFLSVMGLPWMHGALPHSPLHVRALADVEERVAQGHVHEVIMNVRETRLATLIAHLLILASTFYLLPKPLQSIPTSVLHGLFLYMAFTSLSGNEMVERLLLLITEQQAYPPTHYIRRVPQRKVHLFTTCQLIQLIILCAVGFSPYPFIEMVFPIVCFCFLPIRHILIPRLIDYKYLDALDGRH